MIGEGDGVGGINSDRVANLIHYLAKNEIRVTGTGYECRAVLAVTRGTLAEAQKSSRDSEIGS